MKPENKRTQAICVQSHDWAAENQQLRKELLSREKRIEKLEAMASTLNNQLSEKIDQINDMMQKMISFMTTNGDATLLDSLRQSVVAEIRAEFEARELTELFHQPSQYEPLPFWQASSSPHHR